MLASNESAWMRRIILTPVGSAGDVNPFLWAGRVLKDEGHDVTLIASPVFEDAARSRGIDFYPIGDPAEYDAVLAAGLLWHPTRGTPLVLRLAADSTIRLFDCITEVAERRAEPPLLIGSSLAFGARLAHEKYRFQHATFHLQPSACLSAHELPVPLPRLQFVNRLPLWTRRILLGALQIRLDREVRPRIQRACKRASVRPPANVIPDWWNGANATLCLFPEWFASPKPDWPKGTECVGFPLFDRSDQEGISADLEQFLVAGPPPVLFTPGSAMAQCADFFRNARDVAKALEIRAIFATPFTDQLPAELPPGVVTTDYVPFGLVFPRCSAVVHHGGIGTVSQAFAAGTPQLILAMAHDQPDNAIRVHAHGAGSFLMGSNISPQTIASALSEIMTNAPMRQECAQIAERMKSGNPADKLVHALRFGLHGPRSARTTRRIALVRQSRGGPSP